MGDGALSQDEIDALLNEGEDSLSSGGFDLGGGESLSSLLSQNDINTFIDLVNSASGNMGGALGALLGRTVAISNPKVEVISGSNIINQLDPQIVEIVMDYESGAIGQHSYLLDLEVSKAIAGLMVGQESVELTEMTLGAVSEAMNVICGNSSNTIGTKSKKELRTSPPKVEIKSKNNLSLKANENYVKVIYDFNIEGKPLSQLIEIFGLNVIKEIISSIVPVSNMAGGNNTKMMNQQQNMGMPNQMMGMQNTQFQTVQFSSFGNQPTDVPGNNINLLMDVNMELTVELGRTRKPIKEILGMGEGTVIELDKLAGEPVDILVNGRLIARGEVVVIDESFGVRVTEIVDPKDRIK